MENAKKERFSILIHRLCRITKTEFTEEMAEDYAFALEDLSLQDIEKAVRKYVNETNPFLPTPGQLREVLYPSDESQASDVATRITFCIRRFGHNNNELAKEYMGEVAWTVVQRFGGWEAVCSLPDQQTMLQAFPKWRDEAKSLMQKDRRGERDERPIFPSTRKKQQGELQDLSSVLTNIAKPKEKEEVAG